MSVCVPTVPTPTLSQPRDPKELDYFGNTMA